MESQSGFQFEYLQEEIASLRKAKAEEIRLKEAACAQLAASKEKIAHLTNDSKMMVDEIISSIRSSLESMSENHHTNNEQKEQVSNLAKEFEKLKIHAAEEDQLDPNQSDLILNYKISGEENASAPEVDINLSYISQVFQLLPYILSLFTLSGENTESLYQRIVQDQCQLLEQKEQME